MKALLTKYKPALLFLAKFVVIYIVLNVLYGIFIESYHPNPDPTTWLASVHTDFFLNMMGFETYYTESISKPNVLISDAVNGNVLSVYEGCNGLNVMIIFVAFLASFSLNKKLFWFVPLGILLIHLGNLLRIALLYIVSVRMPNYLYFSHKYLFTASIFLLVFVLWYWWLKIIETNKK